jgi:hypothetical protein
MGELAKINFLSFTYLSFFSMNIFCSNPNTRKYGIWNLLFKQFRMNFKPVRKKNIITCLLGVYGFLGEYPRVEYLEPTLQTIPIIFQLESVRNGSVRFCLLQTCSKKNINWRGLVWDPVKVFNL